MQWPEDFRGSGKTSIWGNTFFLNHGPGRFLEVSDKINAENYCPWGPSVGDLNADGYDDIFIASGMNYPHRCMINSLRLNDRGRRFVDAEFLLGAEPRRGGVAQPFFEIDASGRDRARHHLGRQGHPVIRHLRSRRRRRPRHRHQRVSRATDGAHQQSHERTRVRWIAVRLVGTRSNRDGLGSVVRVSAGGQTYTKMYDGSSGYLSHSLYPLYFGLGEAAEVESIEIAWPSGTRQIVGARSRGHRGIGGPGTGRGWSPSGRRLR
jgi:enediyne biosynthesis protein E4